MPTFCFFFILSVLIASRSGCFALERRGSSPTWPSHLTLAQGQVAATCLQAFAEDLMARSASSRVSESSAANRTLSRMHRQPHSQLASCQANHICGGVSRQLFSRIFHSASALVSWINIRVF
uniref:Secreted protein n=1 Tax=Macrostomum lignano TaxID=282301 RepID=A0A1I8GDD3_9PLAT